MGRWWLGVSFSAMVRTAAIGAAVFALSSSATFAQVQPEAAEPAAPATPDAAAPDTAAPAADATAAPVAETQAAASQPAPEAGDWERMEHDFESFLYYANVGRFDLADGVAKSLLAHPDLNPMSAAGGEHLLELSQKYENSLETLVRLIDNSPQVGANAKLILDLVNEAHHRARRNPQRIKENIERLAGSPTQRAFGLDQLKESGEYAVPWMLEALVDSSRAKLHPFIIRTLPLLGRPAVNPLVQALSLKDDVVQGFAAQALGQLGYPQALPYLRRVVESKTESESLHKTVTVAINSIVVNDPRVKEAPADQLFAMLAEQYYAGIESVSPDPREDKVNVWYPAGKTVVAVEVPSEIYNPVMSMRSCEASLDLVKNQPPVAALWVAANFRREARLGLDVQSEEPAQTEDLTRPPDYPRSIYFARSAGADVCRLVLNRALHDVDRNVALGAVAGLAVTAGPAAMTGPGGDGSTSLIQALQFPELLVRLRAALALGKTLPKEPFRGSEDVVRVLSNALSLTGKQFFAVVDQDATYRDQLATELSRRGFVVVAAARLDEALAKAAKGLTHLDGILLASDLKAPLIVDAIRMIARDPHFSLTPVLVYVKKTDNLIADRVAAQDARVGTAFAIDGAASMPALADAILKQYPRTATKYGYEPISPELSLNLALDAVGTLRIMAIRESTVFNLGPSERSLTDALAHPSEELRMGALRVLALLDSPSAQKAIAGVALADAQSEPLRVAAFAALAESGRHFGSRLETAGLQSLVKQTLSSSNLVLRTAASQALGALNPPGTRAADIILAQPSQPPEAVLSSQPAP